VDAILSTPECNLCIMHADLELDQQDYPDVEVPPHRHQLRRCLAKIKGSQFAAASTSHKAALF